MVRCLGGGVQMPLFLVCAADFCFSFIKSGGNVIKTLIIKVSFKMAWNSQANCWTLTIICRFKEFSAHLGSAIWVSVKTHPLFLMISKATYPFKNQSWIYGYICRGFTALVLRWSIWYSVLMNRHVLIEWPCLLGKVCLLCKFIDHYDDSSSLKMGCVFVMFYFAHVIFCFYRVHRSG